MWKSIKQRGRAFPKTKCSPFPTTLKNPRSGFYVLWAVFLSPKEEGKKKDEASKPRV
jgi:hypothetical protein